MVYKKLEAYRGRLNLYGGIALGALTPIALTRYSYGSIESSGNVVIDCLKETGLVAAATVQSLGFQMIALPAGLALGVTSCLEVGRWRKKKTLETI